MTGGRVNKGGKVSGNSECVREDDETHGSETSDGSGECCDDPRDCAPDSPGGWFVSGGGDQTDDWGPWDGDS